MKRFLAAVVWVLSAGLLSNQIARGLPRRFRPDRFPFRAYRFERDGSFYDAFAIRAWKSRVPDMSKYLPWLPGKSVSRESTAEDTELLIQETCVSELIHLVLVLVSFGVLLFWRGPGAAAFLLFYNVLGNLPYLMIQRYNRPRLVRLAQKQRKSGNFA